MCDIPCATGGGAEQLSLGQMFDGKSYNPTLQKAFQGQFLSAVSTTDHRIVSHPGSYREYEARMDPCSRDLLLLTDVEDDPVLDSTRNWAGKKNKQQKLKIPSILMCFAKL